MSKKLYEEVNISDIADAIREKNGTANTYTVAQMSSAVRAIETHPVLEALTVTENGNYLPSAGKDGFSEVTVNIPATEPDLETLTATENGNYVPSAGKDGFSSVTVNVEGGEAVVQPLSVTQNGIYNPPSSVDGFAPVTVNISGGGGATILGGNEEPTSAIGSNGDIYLLMRSILQPLVASQSELNTIVTANSNWSGYDPWKAFSNANAWWIGGGGDPHWLQIEFSSQQKLQEIHFITHDSNRTHPISRIAYSNNGVDFTDAILLESTVDGNSGYASINGDCVGKYFRLIFDGSYGLSYYPGIGHLEMLGKSSFIYDSYCKVNGIWQNLIGSDINDVNR